MKKVINKTEILNGKQALLCLRFIYLRISPIFIFWFFLLTDRYIRSIAADIDS